MTLTYLRGRPLTVVTDGEQRASLAVTRSLGRAGYPVVVCSQRRRSLAGASRWCHRSVQVPDPLQEPGAFAMAIAAVAEQHGAGLVIPITEPSLLAVLQAGEAFCDVVVPFPSLAAFRRISDKRELLEVASELGIAVPEQRTVLDRTAIFTLRLDDLRFPVVLKPSRSVSEDQGGRTKLGVEYAGSPVELAARLRVLPDAAFPVLLQTRIVGPGVGIFLLVWEDGVRAVFAHRRIREKPPSGGVSVYRESIMADPALVDASRALLERFSWRGVAMVEYKVDEDTGTPYLMEVNGRFWGSLQLAVDAGVDFPRLLAEAALGARAEPAGAYRHGIRSRWWWGDVDHLIARLRSDSRTLFLPPGEPSRWGTIVDFLKVWRPGDRNEVLRTSDIRPFIRETLDWFARR